MAWNNMKISLIKLKEIHVPLFYKWWNTGFLRKLTSQTYEKMTKEEIDKILPRKSKSFTHDFIIYVDGKPVGHILIQKKKGKKYFELYIAIGKKEYWNKGVGSKAITKAVKWFFRQYPLELVLMLDVLPNNLRAIRCYEKVGFKRVRILKHKNFPDTVLMKLNKL